MMTNIQDGAYDLGDAASGAYDFIYSSTVAVVRDGKLHRVYRDAWCGDNLYGYTYRRFCELADGRSYGGLNRMPACYREPTKAISEADNLPPDQQEALLASVNALGRRLSAA